MRKLLKDDFLLTIQTFATIKWDGPYKLEEITEHSFKSRIGAYDVHISAERIIVEQLEPQQFVIQIDKLEKLHLSRNDMYEAF